MYLKREMTLKFKKIQKYDTSTDILLIKSSFIFRIQQIGGNDNSSFLFRVRRNNDACDDRNCSIGKKMSTHRETKSLNNRMRCLLTESGGTRWVSTTYRPSSSTCWPPRVVRSWASSVTRSAAASSSSPWRSDRICRPASTWWSRWRRRRPRATTATTCCCSSRWSASCGRRWRPSDWSASSATTRRFGRRRGSSANGRMWWLWPECALLWRCSIRYTYQLWRHIRNDTAQYVGAQNKSKAMETITLWTRVK